VTSIDAIRSKATLRRKGTYFEDFAVGQRFDHHWGRTVTESDAIVFTTLTMNYNPIYHNVEYARSEGHPRLVVNPMLAFLTVFGLSVEDLSELGGAFLGVDNLVFHRPVYINSTLTASSTVLSVRESSKRPTEGIVAWHTEGRNKDDELVLEYDRTNLVTKKHAS
jgi:itaconyl-CoA hydratase